MNKDLRHLVPAPGYTVLWILLISNFVSHSACDIDIEKIKYCRWYAPNRCPNPDVDGEKENWDCLREESECAYGKQYHCARHYNDRSTILDGCAESKECLAGEAPYLDYTKHGRPTSDLHVSCDKCHDKEHYNDMNRNSSTYSECKRKTTCHPLYGIECNPVDEKSQDIYRRNRECRCNTFENYMFSQSTDGEICTSERDLASSCRKVQPCKKSMERLQNGTCVPKCVIGHRTKDSDECIEDPGTITSSKTSQSTHSTAKIPHTSPSISPSQTVISTSLPSVTQSSKTDKRVSSNPSGVMVAVLTLIFIAILLIAILLIRRWKWLRSKCKGKFKCGGRRQPRRHIRNDTNYIQAIELQPLSQMEAGPRQSEVSESIEHDMDQSDRHCQPCHRLDEIQEAPSVEPQLSELGDGQCQEEVSESLEHERGQRGQTVIQGPVFDMTGIKNVNIVYGMNENQEKTEDEYQNVRRTQENQRREVQNEINKVSDVETKLEKALLDDLAVVVLRKCHPTLVEDLDAKKTGDYLYHFDVISPGTNNDISVFFFCILSFLSLIILK